MRSFVYKGPGKAIYVRDYPNRRNVLLEKGKPYQTGDMLFQRVLADHPDVEEVKAEAKPEKASPRRNGES